MSNTFFLKSCDLRDHKEKYDRARQATAYGGEENKRKTKVNFHPRFLT
jgi:hypothetical protein